jgi:hypothetical protein
MPLHRLHELNTLKRVVILIVKALQNVDKCPRKPHAKDRVQSTTNATD